MPWREDGLASFNGYRFATVESSRGCCHLCSFCLPAAFYRRLHSPYRRRDPAHVAGELDELYGRGVRLVLFDDEQFLPQPSTRSEFVSRLAEHIHGRGLKMAFTAKCRADDIDATLFATLKSIGLVRTFVGIESGCQETLDLYGKGTRVQQNIAALKTLKVLGIVADFRSLLFHPWTTLGMLDTEIDFLESIRPCLATGLDFRALEVYFGTPMAKRLESEGRLDTRSWQIEYSIRDASAELARRFARLLFMSSREYHHWLSSLSQAWCGFLLDQRLSPIPGDARRAERLQDLAQSMNDQVLQIWREILAFVRSGPIHEVAEVNRRGAEWGLHIHVLAREHSNRVSQS